MYKSPVEGREGKGGVVVGGGEPVLGGSLHENASVDLAGRRRWWCLRQNSRVFCSSTMQKKNTGGEVGVAQVKEKVGTGRKQWQEGTTEAPALGSLTYREQRIEGEGYR